VHEPLLGTELTLVGVFPFDKQQAAEPHQIRAIRPAGICAKGQFKRYVGNVKLLKGAFVRAPLNLLLPPKPAPAH